MAQVIVVTSGKGGVGKTTSSAAFATGLAQRGKKTVVIDFDVGLRNLDLIMGVERRVVFDIINVIQGEARLSQALIRDKRVEVALHPAGVPDQGQGYADQGRRRENHRGTVEGIRLYPV
jgi:septum site-determining protein MinD